MSGLDDLSNETRLIATPWSRMVRGLGLGQYPVDFDVVAAGNIRRTLDRLVAASSPDDAYTRFAARLTDVVLDVLDPAGRLSETDLELALGLTVQAVETIAGPYFRTTARCILMDACVKLGIGRELLSGDRADLPEKALADLDRIAPDGIRDENQGLHGDYEKLSACSAVFLAFGQLGLADRLVTGPRNRVREALGLLERVPAPFFRGRGGSMLFSVLSLLGFDSYVAGEGRDHLREVLDRLDRADEVGLVPSFPSPMTEAFPKVYPLVTMLNAVAVSGRAGYLTADGDRLAEARALIGAISPVERTHMGLYYLMALHNLGRLGDQIPDLDAFVEDVVGRWRHVDPGSDYFLNGISYPYIIQTAVLTGRTDLVTGAAVERLVDSFPDLDRSAESRANRPYPVSYVLNVLGEIGLADRLFLPRARYGGLSPLDWVIDHLSPGARLESGRLYMLDHALISYALRLRGAGGGDTELFARFRFPFTGSGGAGGPRR